MTSRRMNTLYTGRCTCGDVQYRMTAEPMSVHCCHCTWCQRETGSAFVLNALIETEHLEVLGGAPVTIDTPSNSGKGQKIVRCPTCYVALYSHYAGMGDILAFVRVGTLEETAPWLLTCTSSRAPSSPGSRSRRTSRPSPSTTRQVRSGNLRASSDVPVC